jgi:hypothetical protein
MSAEIYSFNDIIMATWDSLRDKAFIRNDTNEYLGSVYAKYDKMWSLATMCTNGRVEFLNQEHSNIKRVFGEDLNTDEKMFIAQSKL